MQSLNESFIETIAHSDLSGVTENLAEVAFDCMLKDGPLKDIPVLGTLIGTYKGILAIREAIFTKKIIRFLASMSTLSSAQRERMFHEIEKNGVKRQEVGEAVLLILDQMDDFTKASMLGILMKSLSRSVIDYDKFLRFSSILNRSYVKDLMQLPNFVTTKYGNVGSTLYSLGLLTPINYFANDTEEDKNEYRISTFGFLLCSALEITLPNSNQPQ
jgi:hypothetical protein